MFRYTKSNVFTEATSLLRSVASFFGNRKFSKKNKYITLFAITAIAAYLIEKK